jgi:hypothetical protein
MDKEDKMSSLKTYDREDCSSGFQPGDEWEGNDGGKAVRGQNDHAQGNPRGIMHASKMNACTPRIKIGYAVKMTAQLKPRKPPRKSSGFQPGDEWEGNKEGINQHNRMRGQNDPVAKMNPCTTKDRNVVGYQNDTAPESPKTAAKKSEGFQPGDEWEGNPGGKAVRAQNEHVVKSHETAKKVGEQFGKSQATVRRGSSQGIQVMKCEIMHGVKMTPCTTKDRNVVGYQNDTAPESLKAAAEKAGFQEGNPGYEMRKNAGVQNDPQHNEQNVVEGQNGPAPETPSKASEKVGKATNTTLEEISNGSKMNPLHTKDRNRIRGQNDHAAKTAQTANTTALILIQMLVFYH